MPLHFSTSLPFASISLGLTRHSVEEPLPSPVIGLQVLAVQRPVDVRDEAKRLVTFSYFLIPLGNSIDIHRAIVGPHRQVRTIWGKLHFMNDFFSVFDMDHFCHVSVGIKRKVTVRGSRNRKPRSCFERGMSQERKIL